jgi:NADPH2:quinone reductase
MVMTAHGGPEVLKLQDLAIPEAGPGEILVKVVATSVNPFDVKLRKGEARVRIEPPAVLGHDAAGVVEAVGHATRAFKPGDRVFYSPRPLAGPGTYADYNVVPESIAAPLPAGLSLPEAASLPLAGSTAWAALIERAGLTLGETVLIHAGAGGVGSLAIQIARAAGAQVLTTCRPENADLVGDLGAAAAIDYLREDFVEAVLRLTAGRGVDAVLDTVGGDTLARSIGCTRPHGRLVSLVNTSGDLLPGYVRNLTFHLLFMERSREKLEHVSALVERGLLRPVIDSVFGLEELAAAHARLEQGGVRGKIAVTVGQPE